MSLLRSASGVRRIGVAAGFATQLTGCELIDRPPTAIPNGANLTLLGGPAELALAASGSLMQTGDVGWTLAKTGSRSGTTVTWEITATQIATVPGQLVITGALTLANKGAGPATIGNVVVNLQTRVNKQWVTVSSDIADATQGDAATGAVLHAQASSEGLAAFSENGASGALAFTDATSGAAVSLVPQLMVDAGATRALEFSAVFDNTDVVLQLPAGTPVRAEVIVSFGNATANGKSAANVDINGSGALDADEAYVRSVAKRLPLTVLPPVNGRVTLSDALADIVTTGTVTFSNAQFTLGATSGTAMATVDGGASGGTITNCAHLTTGDQSLDLTSCSTVDVAAEPPDCTPGAPGCGWSSGDMRTFTQVDFGDSQSAAGGLLNMNYNGLYGGTLQIGGSFFAVFTTASAVFAYLPQVAPASTLSSSVQNPVTTSSGELGGEVLALKLNVDFSAASIINNAVDLGSLRICNYVDVPVLNGQTVNQFLTIANTLLGGGGGPFAAFAAATVAREINNAFVDGVPSTFAQSNLFAGSCPTWQQGDMTTETQNSWGDPTSNAAALLSANFMSVFGASIVLGGTATATFTDPLAVFNYLPATGPAGPLVGNVQDPSTTSSGELGGEVLALTLNIELSAASVLPSAVPLGSLRICNFSLLPAVNGATIGQFLATANNLLGGGAAPFGPSSAAAVARLINAAFVDGTPSTFAQNNLVAGTCP